MDKKKSTKKNSYYYIILRYNYTENGEIKSAMTRITSDGIPTFGVIATAAEKHSAVKHGASSYIEGSAIMTFFQKITRKQAKDIYDTHMPDDTTIKIL